MGHTLDETRAVYFRASPEKLKELYLNYAPFLTIQKEFIEESKKIEQSVLEDKPMQNKRYQLLQKNLIAKIEEAKSNEERKLQNFRNENLK
jgi:hypothetical protein